MGRSRSHTHTYTHTQDPQDTCTHTQDTHMIPKRQTHTPQDARKQHTSHTHTTRSLQAALGCTNRGACSGSAFPLSPGGRKHVRRPAPRAQTLRGPARPCASLGRSRPRPHAPRPHAARPGPAQPRSDPRAPASARGLARAPRAPPPGNSRLGRPRDLGPGRPRPPRRAMVGASPSGCGAGPGCAMARRARLGERAGAAKGRPGSGGAQLAAQTSTESPPPPPPEEEPLRLEPSAPPQPRAETDPSADLRLLILTAGNKQCAGAGGWAHVTAPRGRGGASLAAPETRSPDPTLVWRDHWEDQAEGAGGGNKVLCGPVLGLPPRLQGTQ